MWSPLSKSFYAHEETELSTFENHGASIFSLSGPEINIRLRNESQMHSHSQSSQSGSQKQSKQKKKLSRMLRETEADNTDLAEHKNELIKKNIKKLNVHFKSFSR